MALQRREELVSAELARRNLRAFDQLLALPPLTPGCDICGPTFAARIASLRIKLSE